MRGRAICPPWVCPDTNRSTGVDSINRISLAGGRAESADRLALGQLFSLVAVRSWPNKVIPAH